jgi:hypothetical protein
MDLGGTTYLCNQACISLILTVCGGSLQYTIQQIKKVEGQKWHFEGQIEMPQNFFFSWTVGGLPTIPLVWKSRPRTPLYKHLRTS